MYYYMQSFKFKRQNIMFGVYVYYEQHTFGIQAFKRMETEYSHHSRLRKSQESYTSDGDSGVGPDSTGSSRMPSMEGYPGYNQEEQTPNEDACIYYSWMVEECILAAYGKKCVTCPTHFDIPLSQIAPDTVSSFLYVLIVMNK